MLSAIYAAKRNRENGFTLLELLIVVIVIGILAAISLPIFLNQQKAAIDAAVKSDVRNTAAQVIGWRAQHAGVAPDSAESYVAQGGRMTTSNGTYVDVEFTSADAYTVCGYNPGGNLADYAHAWKYDGATGHFAASAADCTNAVHLRGSDASAASDTSGDKAGADTTDVVTLPVAADGTGTSTSGGSGAGTGTGSSGGGTVIAYDPGGKKTITPGSGGNSNVPGKRGANDPTPSNPTPSAPSSGPSGGGSSSPTTGDPATGTGTTPISASPGGTTLMPYAVGAGNPSCSYSAAPVATSSFIDANCHKVHVANVRTVTVVPYSGSPYSAYVYEFDHDATCEAEGVAAGYDKNASGSPKNMDAQGRPCDWLMLGGAFGITSSNASYGDYPFDSAARPKGWYGTGPSTAEAPCAMPVYPTNFQKYAFKTCLTDHGWAAPDWL